MKKYVILGGNLTTGIFREEVNANEFLVEEGVALFFLEGILVCSVPADKYVIKQIEK